MGPLDLQTIGEEYTGILQVTSATDGRKFKIPSKWARLIMIGTESFGPLILKHWSKIAGVKNPNILKFLDLFEYASQFHIIWFYLEETFYQISKRIVDVQYIKLRFESFTFSIWQISFKTYTVFLHLVRAIMEYFLEGIAPTIMTFLY